MGMTIDLDALEKLADEATPGPWFQSGPPWFSAGSVVISGSPDPHAGTILLDTAETWEMQRSDDGLDADHERDPDNDAAFIAAADPATIKALIAELKEARTMAHTINRVLSPQADRTFDLLISQSQWAVDTCRAFLARNGEEK